MSDDAKATNLVSSGGSLADLLVQTSVDGLTVIDREHRYLLWNRAMEGFSGKRAEEVLGKCAFDVFPFLREIGLAAAAERAFAGETVTAEAVPHQEPDGTFRYYDRLYLPFRGADGEILGMLGIVRDATARRNAEDALRASEAQLRMAVDAGGVGLWRWDFRLDRVKWEDSLCAIFGIPPEAAPPDRATYLTLIHPDDRKRSAERSASGLAAGGWADEYRIIRGDGAVRWVMSQGKVIDSKGENAGVLSARQPIGDVVFGAVIDVTDRREREEQLRQAQKLEAVGQLTAGIAHNFNNVLMGMLPNLEIAARRAPPELAPLLRGVEQSAERAAELVRQLMTYAGRNRPRARSVEPMAALAERTVTLCRTTFDQQIAIEVRADPTAYARVDPAQIEQALLNALINARDAVTEADVSSPRVTLEVDVVREGSPELGGRIGDHVRLRVRDNGVGMAPATANRVFEPFFTTKPVGKGTGLGLATTRTILLEHGGFVTCASEPRKGTTLSLYLRREEAGRASRAPPVADAEPASVRGTETILVVDDEAPIRQLVSLMLSGAGFTAKAAASGEEAIALLRDRQVASEIALVLLDVSMPGISGRALRARLRELAPGARVVYFTGYAFEAADPEDAVLEKPVTEKRLLGTIREVLDRAPSERLSIAK